MKKKQVNKTTNKFIFSGHESFQCRQQWLKKGYDFVKLNKSFSDEDAVVELGVGRNMVNSVKFWLKAFNIIDTTEKITPFGDFIFNDQTGFDKYLEDEGTLWLLHYHLVKTGYASSYNFMFNEFRRERLEFTRENFVSFIAKKGIELGFQFKDRTISDDFDVLLKLYNGKTAKNESDETLSGLLSDLQLISNVGREYYSIDNIERPTLPDLILLYSIIDSSPDSNSINLSSLEFTINSPSNIFAINKSDLYSKVSLLSQSRRYRMVFKDHAGTRELQFRQRITPHEVLQAYYEN